MPRLNLPMYHGQFQIRRRVETTVQDVVGTTEAGYRSYLRLRYGAGKVTGYPLPIPMNTTLKTKQEVSDALLLVRKLGLVPHSDPTKTWDSLGAVGCILSHTNVLDPILDAGGELYSPVLPSLSLCGYRNLVAVNLNFKRSYKRGPIRYLPGDLLNTPFANETFGAICCLSVIEHGVDLGGYVREMAQLLKPGGVLVTSTDYWCSPVETFGLRAYGVPIQILGPREIENMIALAREVGLEPTGTIDLTCKERVARWHGDRLAFTFLTFTLRKTA